MIHRALFGSVERFFGILVEHYAGAFPTWLAPVQVRVLRRAGRPPGRYADELVERLRAAGFRADTVDADEPLGARIRRAKLEKLPYVLVVGDDDVGRRGDRSGVNATAGGRGRAGRRRRRLLARLDAEVAPYRVVGAYGGRANGTRSAVGRLALGVRHGEGVDIAGDRRAPRGEPEGAEDRCSSGSWPAACPTSGTFVLWRGTRCAALLNTYPYTTGHLMVLPRRAVADLDGLEPDESAELWAGVQLAVRALRAAYQPEGINVGANLGTAAGAGVPDHLHVHVPAPLVGRHQLHDRRGRDPGAARVARGQTWQKLRTPGPNRRPPTAGGSVAAR